MKRILTTKTCSTMLLALLALAWSNNAWASVTINVKSNETIYLYVWDDTEDETPLNGAWPGTPMTTTTTVQNETWFTQSFLGYDKVNFILSKGGETADQTKTSDLSTDPNNKGVKNGSVYYEYNESFTNKANNLTDIYDIPAGVTYEANTNCVYFVNSNEWEKPKLYIRMTSGGGYGNQNANYPGEDMTMVGTNSNGWDIYKWTGLYPSQSGDKLIVITDNGDGNKTSGEMNYVQNGYYSGYNYTLITTITSDRNEVVYNTPAYFYDANMRAALEDALGVPASSTNVTDATHAIASKSVKVLDISGKNITNLASNSAGNSNGIAYFTELEELYANNNNITHANLEPLTKLRILDMHGNNGLEGFGVNAATTSNKIINIPPAESNVMEYVDLSNCNVLYTAALTSRANSNLRTLILADNTNLGTPNLSNFSNLNYLDISNTGLTEANSKTILNTTALSNLETLKANNNSNMKYAYTKELSSLKHLEIANGDLYFRQGTASTPYQLMYLTPTNNPNLEYLDISTDQIGTHVEAINGFQNLKIVIANGNPSMPFLTINNCPRIETIVVDNNTSMTTLGITNCGLTEMPSVTDLATTTALTKIDLTGNAFEAVPEVGGSVNTMVMNSNQLENIAVPSNIQYLYAQNNNFASEYSLPETSLVGLDLGNNGFTKFTAIKEGAITDEWAIDYTQTPPVTIQSNANESDGSNTTLQALHLGGNPNLENVTVNGYKGLTKLASGNDMTTAEGKGLYVKDNTALKTLDISNNHIEILGQDGSLSGLSGLETLNASHNKIMTLTNKSAITGGSNPRAHYGANNYDVHTCPNIEDLTGLKELNLSYNLLSDSIHLWKNTALERLDVSHNRTITKRNAGETQYYRNTKDGTFAPWHYAAWKTEADQYTGDLNDTIGLRMLDLYRNVNLKYLDISYTNIENTAENWTFVNNRVGPENLEPNASLGRWSVPRFVLVNHCPELVEFHSNYNAMKSLGVGRVPMSTSVCEVTGCPKLEVLEARECRGQDPKIMQGEITISVHNPLIRYYDVSNSDFDKINPYKVDGNEVSGQSLETLIIDGNYTRDNSEHWSLADAGTLDVSQNPKLINLQANKCPNLITVKANGLADLSVVSVKQDTTVTTVNNESVTTKLANIYVDHDAILNEVQGLETLSALSVYHANDSHFTGGFVMPTLAKSTLTDLRVGNETLALAETRNNLTAVDLTGYTAVKHLETQNNPSIATLNLAGFTGTLEHINFANNHIENNGIGIDETTGALPALPALKYFNCSNDSKWSTSAGNSLTDLVLTSSTGIKEIHANNNDLHRITGSFANLTNIEFAHNHINGIDLSAAANNNPTINAEDNGREITAECAKFYQNGQLNPTNEITVFFFQLNDINANGQTIDNSQPLASKTSEDSNGATRYLGKDGFNLSGGTNQLDAWSGTNAALYVPPTSPSGISPKDVTIDPSNMSQYLTGDVPGQIVVLKEDPDNPAEGRATYTYNTGAGNCEFYLDWNANADIPTAIKDITVDNNISIANSYGHLTVNGADGTVVNVYDMNGRQVANETISGGTATINGLASGIYIVNGNKVIVR